MVVQPALLIVFGICCTAIGATLPFYFQRYAEWKAAKEKKRRREFIKDLQEAFTSLPHRLGEIKNDVMLDGMSDIDPSEIIEVPTGGGIPEQEPPELTDEEKAIASDRKSGAIAPLIPNQTGLIKKGHK